MTSEYINIEGTEPHVYSPPMYPGYIHFLQIQQIFLLSKSSLQWTSYTLDQRRPYYIM